MCWHWILVIYQLIIAFIVLYPFLFIEAQLWYLCDYKNTAIKRPNLSKNCLLTTCWVTPWVWYGVLGGVGGMMMGLSCMGRNLQHHLERFHWNIAVRWLVGINTQASCRESNKNLIILTLSSLYKNVCLCVSVWRGSNQIFGLILMKFCSYLLRRNISDEFVNG